MMATANIVNRLKANKNPRTGNTGGNDLFVLTAINEPTKTRIKGLKMLCKYKGRNINVRNCATEFFHLQIKAKHISVFIGHNLNVLCPTKYKKTTEKTS